MCYINYSRSSIPRVMGDVSGLSFSTKLYEVGIDTVPTTIPLILSLMLTLCGQFFFLNFGGASEYTVGFKLYL